MANHDLDQMCQTVDILQWAFRFGAGILPGKALVCVHINRSGWVLPIVKDGVWNAHKCSKQRHLREKRMIGPVIHPMKQGFLESVPAKNTENLKARALIVNHL